MLEGTGKYPRKYRTSATPHSSIGSFINASAIDSKFCSTFYNALFVHQAEYVKLLAHQKKHEQGCTYNQINAFWSKGKRFWLIEWRIQYLGLGLGFQLPFFRMLRSMFNGAGTTSTQQPDDFGKANTHLVISSQLYQLNIRSEANTKDLMQSIRYQQKYHW